MADTKKPDNSDDRTPAQKVADEQLEAAVQAVTSKSDK